jgi:nucleoside-diphosphate-sugar epimerase
VKKICVVGSTGYVGSYLCEYLKNDFQIISCSRKKINNSLFNKNIRHFIYGDITRHKVVDQIVYALFFTRALFLQHLTKRQCM